MLRKAASEDGGIGHAQLIGTPPGSLECAVALIRTDHGQTDTWIIGKEESYHVDGKLRVINTMERSHPHEICLHVGALTERVISEIQRIGQHLDCRTIRP